MEQTAESAYSIQCNAINEENCADARTDSSARDDILSVKLLSEVRAPYRKRRLLGERACLGNLREDR
jgi:hypothetical protein